MREKIQGLVTGLVRHTDRTTILTLYTRSRGRMAFAVPAAADSNPSRFRYAQLVPLAVISADVQVDNSREITPLYSFDAIHLWQKLYFSPRKAPILSFFHEFLAALLRELPPDEDLFDFIVDSLGLLESLRGSDIDVFPEEFLASLLPYLGIQPDTDAFSGAQWFDMRAGCYSSLRPPHPDILAGELLPLPLRWSAATIPAGGDTTVSRQEALAVLLKYIGVHCPGLDKVAVPQFLF